MNEKKVCDSGRKPFLGITTAAIFASGPSEAKAPIWQGRHQGFKPTTRTTKTYHISDVRPRLHDYLPRDFGQRLQSLALSEFGQETVNQLRPFHRLLDPHPTITCLLPIRYSIQARLHTSRTHRDLLLLFAPFPRYIDNLIAVIMVDLNRDRPIGSAKLKRQTVW